MRYPLTPRSITLDDLELISVRIFERIARDFADFGGNNS